MPFEAVQAAKSNPGQSKAVQTDQQKQPKADRSNTKQTKQSDPKQSGAGQNNPKQL